MHKVVYKIEYKQWKTNYIGQTSNNLRKIFKQHIVTYLGCVRLYLAGRKTHLFDNRYMYMLYFCFRFSCLDLFLQLAKELYEVCTYTQNLAKICRSSYVLAAFNIALLTLINILWINCNFFTMGKVAVNYQNVA